MTQRDFCYWLQGYFELLGAPSGVGLTPSQTQCIREHLALTFKQVVEAPQPPPTIAPWPFGASPQFCLSEDPLGVKVC
jgi:hypothetical protein